ncbi:MAG: cytochrome-c peroxidase [Candidatus Kapabacteria bacterium]|nr:cytochrome-c peroxidase [Ignavibacteriota bacterium]MCW5884935.1 cytochrome-c peroxidase [Candidatus Kapabacteria bacterium]
MKKILSLFFITILLLSSCGEDKSGDTPEQKIELSAEAKADLLARAKQIFGALPDKMPGSENDTPELVELGKTLYFETRLSVNNTQSCNTCHDITNGKAGDDNLRVSPGAIEGKEGVRNSPTVLNAGFQFVQFWDGREPDLHGQAKGPILNPDEMAMPSEKECETLLSGIPEYQEMFGKAFPGVKNAITYDNLAHAIAAFERTLISKSRFDDYVNGNPTALTNAELNGLKTFIDVGCITCHTGPLFGGSMYQKMGLIKPYANVKDLGRYDVTKNDLDKYFFKVAQLRNVTLTAPYYHDGAVESLDEAINTMADINLGKQLTADETKSIKTFLQALTDKNLEKGIAIKF